MNGQMNWKDVLPKSWARKQENWERMQRRGRLAAHLRRSGFTLAQTGAALGVSRERIRQVLCSYERRKNKLAPIELFCLSNSDIAEMARLIRRAQLRERNIVRLPSDIGSPSAGRKMAGSHQPA